MKKLLNIMKKLLYLVIALILGCFIFVKIIFYGHQSTVNVDGKEITIGKIRNLDVMSENLGSMNWYEAKKVCKNLGDGWRLPTKDELNLLSSNKGSIYDNMINKDNLHNNIYWSSTEYDSAYSGTLDQGTFELNTRTGKKERTTAWVQSPFHGLQWSEMKSSENHNVRAVRVSKSFHLPF